MNSLSILLNVEDEEDPMVIAKVPLLTTSTSVS
jgi:hypothetical protein